MKSPKSQLKPSGLPSSSRPLLSILTLSPPATLRTLRRALLPPAVRLRLPSLLDTLISSAPIDSSPAADSVSGSAAALTSTVPPATTEVPAAPTLPAPLDLAALLANAQLQAGSVASLHGIPIEHGPRLPIGIPRCHLTGIYLIVSVALKIQMRDDCLSSLPGCLCPKCEGSRPYYSRHCRSKLFQVAWPLPRHARQIRPHRPRLLQCVLPQPCALASNGLCHFGLAIWLYLRRSSGNRHDAKRHRSPCMARPREPISGKSGIACAPLVS